MQTIQLDIAEDKLDVFLTIIKNLKNDIVQNIRFPDATMVEDSVDLSKYGQEIEQGLNSPILDESHEEIFKELKK
jgi:hypothetical protein